MGSLLGGGRRVQASARIVFDAAGQGKFQSSKSPGEHVPLLDASMEIMRYNLSMNPNIPIAQLLSLPIDKRNVLIKAIWGNTVREVKSIPVTDSQKAELDRREAWLHANGALGSSWEEAKARILSRLPEFER